MIFFYFICRDFSPSGIDLILMVILAKCNNLPASFYASTTNFVRRKTKKKINVFFFFEEFIKPKNNIIDASYIAFAIIFQGV